MSTAKIREPQMTREESWCGYAIKSALYKAYPILSRKNGVFEYYECKSADDDVSECKVASKKLNPWGVGTFGGGRHERTPDKKPRAADIYLDARDENEVGIGNEILEKLLKNAVRLRVKYVTWNKTVHYPDGSKTALSGKWEGNASRRHENHLHVEFTDKYNTKAGIVEAFNAVFPPAAATE
jgi:hypothetical protein